MTEPTTAAERLIEVTIGLWPDDDPPGKRPPRLAAAIVKALRDEGFTILQPSEPATAAGWLLRTLTRIYRNTDWLENPPPRRKFYRLPGRRR